MRPRFPQAGILVVDDEHANCVLLKRILNQTGYSSVVTATDPRTALELYERFQPDLVALDLRMPHIDGFQMLTELQNRTEGAEYVPVLVLTADITEDSKQKALTLGARDFVTKPFNAIEVVLRIQNLLEVRFLTAQLRAQNEALEVRVGERTRQLENAHIETLERLAVAAEYRDDETGAHIRRVGRTARLLAKGLLLPDHDAEVIGLVAPLHDVGKIGVPDAVLMKPTSLTPEEFAIVEQHTTIGDAILSGDLSPLLVVARQIALTHHERWDGNGYPSGLKGEQIPLPGRITAVADVFDALINERRYKQAWPVDRAIDYVAHEAAHAFDPDVVDVFRGLIQRRMIELPVGAA